MLVTYWSPANFSLLSQLIALISIWEPCGYGTVTPQLVRGTVGYVCFNPVRELHFPRCSNCFTGDLILSNQNELRTFCRKCWNRDAPLWYPGG